MKGKRLVFGDEPLGWLTEQLGHDEPPKEAQCIGIASDRILAAVGFTRYTEGVGIELTIASDAKVWAYPDFFRAVFRYTFLQLDCKRATAMVGSKNTASQKLCEHLGFVREGCMKHGMAGDDAVIYGIYKESCRWIQ